MRVELTEFCQEFTTVLKPLSGTLDQSIIALHDLEDSSSVGTLLSDFVDIRHRLRILTDKAEQQHAYLLIFGPLKSGKSTLMNAISGSYVSEVSSLPAYPCLVYVQEGESRKCSITRFDGSTENFEREADLHQRIADAHADLAEELRRADQEQRTFNPAVDFPQAIRRVDFTVPAPNLRQSGTILVDTPGLYTKMRYNYEQLTRDFRHNAACAVFVVKTDNLFYDQVFDEFKDLLGFFSRIFLVVNIDASKKDLGADGNLAPALESRDPGRIIEAFENLTVSAQMREAIDDGRLRIYLVDVLGTARRSLSGETFRIGATPPEESAAQAEPEATELAAAPEQPQDTPPTGNQVGDSANIGFKAFIGDLTEYLNSSGYIIEFMADSLRQSQMLIDEIHESVGTSNVKRFREVTDDLKRHADAAAELIKRVDGLENQDWEAHLNAVKSELDAERKSFSDNAVESLRKSLETRVHEWFETDDSLQALVASRLQPAISETFQQLRSRVETLVRERFRQRNGGLKLDAMTVGHLHKLGITLDDCAGGAPEPATTASNAAKPKQIDLLQDQLPVKKLLLDWLTFRSPQKVRRRLLGDENPSNQPLPAVAKEKRLGEAGKTHILDQVGRHVNEDLRSQDSNHLEAETDSFRSHFLQAVRAKLSKRRAELQAEELELRRRHENHCKVNRSLDLLIAATSGASDQTTRLHGRFVEDKQAEIEEEVSEDLLAEADADADAETEVETIAKSDVATGASANARTGADEAASETKDGDDEDEDYALKPQTPEHATSPAPPI
jgi:GTPase SAR1 family protein